MNLMKSVMERPVERGKIGIWWIGQSGFFLKLSNQKIILIDAYLSDSVAKKNHRLIRTVPPPVLPHQVVCDYYICSHNHLDHTDPETIRGLMNRDHITFFGPQNTVGTYREPGIPQNNILILEVGENVTQDGFSLTGTFAIPNDDAVLDSIGILIITEGGIVFYHTGDTAYHPLLHYIKKFDVDIAASCINGKFGNMNIYEATELIKALDPSLVIPTHFDMFSENSVDPGSFQELCIQEGICAQCMIPVIGKLIIYPEKVTV